MIVVRTMVLAALLLTGCTSILPLIDQLNFAPVTAVDAEHLNIEVVYFRIDPPIIDRGETITLSWEVQGVDHISIEQYYGYRTGYDARYPNLPAQGSLQLTLRNTPANSLNPLPPYIYSATFFLLLPDAQPSVWYSADGVLAWETVEFRCPIEPVLFAFDSDAGERFCPLAAASSQSMTYQSFEHGFMLRRSDNGTIYVMYTNPTGSDGPAVLFPAPSDSVSPDDALKQLHENSHHALVDSLGQVAGTPVTYLAVVEESYNDSFTSPVLAVTLPDERVMLYVADLYGAAWRYIH